MEEQLTKMYRELLRFVWLIDILNSTLPSGKTKRVYILKLERQVQTLTTYGFTAIEIRNCVRGTGYEWPENLRIEVTPIRFPNISKGGEI